MRMPTDVAVGTDGSVFVADGVNDRILRFSSAGKFVSEIQEVGQERLSRPIGITIDESGRLWIADTGRRRVLVRTNDGRLERTIVPQTGREEHAADITDIAVSRDGKYAWLVDNDNHRLLRVDLDTSTQMQVGRQGESVGQLKYPFMLTIATDGRVIVTDVINARLHVFSKSGAPRRTIGVYGVNLGELYRPKGLVCDLKGNIWVSDGTLGVVQIFNSDGLFIDVLRDKGGQPFRFQSPMGLAIREDSLYVVELAADRVRRLEITRATPRPVRRPSSPRPRVVGRQARACTICHIEWIEPFSKGVGTILMDAPAKSQDEPVVSRSEACLSCHDGSVADSRRRVWEEHGHLTNIMPSNSMQVPPYLPLVNGKIACRTCHSAHMGGDFSGDIRKSVFLRVSNTASQLCIGCHQDKTGGPEFGTHPIGGMPWPVPQNLVRAGAKVGPNPREITCQVCHTPHGAGYDHLLVMGTESNQLCLSCHDQMRPGMFREGAHSEHPLDPIVNDAQKMAVHAMGTRLGPDDQLICLSCHKLHHGKGDRFMLAQELTDGQMCLACHSEKTSLLATSHDLRTNFPDERNRLDMTPKTGGPCSACHLFHRYARPAETHPLDPRGLCITCHQKDRCGGSRTIGPINHPQSHCTDCHDPHETRFEHYMRLPAADLCATCHKEQAQLAGGLHDVHKNSAAWPQQSVDSNDRCLACHRPHGTEESGLFRVASKKDEAAADGICLACHPASAWGATGSLAAVHPREMIDAISNRELPVVHDKADGSVKLGCRTCHDPHGSPKNSPKLLRVQEGEPSTTLCTQCHSEMQHIALTGHGSNKLAEAGFEATSCRPCHSVHANPAFVGGKLLSMPSAANGVTDLAGNYCVSCHKKGGSAKPPAVATHPEVPMLNVSADGSLGFMPLFDEQGRVDPRGAIRCLTCHVPHGRIVNGTNVEPFSGLERRAMRLLLRAFTPPNVCTSCHGTDALRRFLYFHDPDRRGGPLASPTESFGPAALDKLP